MSIIISVLLPLKVYSLPSKTMVFSSAPPVTSMDTDWSVGVIFMLSIEFSGRLSSHTLPQIPLVAVYHIPPRFLHCLPYGKSKSSGSLTSAVISFSPFLKNCVISKLKGR